jgi:hypothetical protein
LLDLAVIAVAELPPVAALLAAGAYELCAELVADCALVVAVVLLPLLPQPAIRPAVKTAATGRNLVLATGIHLHVARSISPGEFAVGLQR